MKKITFILLALIAGSTFAQNDSKGTAEVFAVIAQPLIIEASGNLDFGTIAAPEAASDVVLSPLNVRTMAETMKIPGDLDTSVPTFTVTKEAGLTYKIVTSKTDLTLAGENNIVIKDIVTSLETVTGVTASSFTVGATIALGAAQGPGNYKGEVAVTVSYE